MTEEEALLDAIGDVVRGRDIEEFKRLLEKGTDVNAKYNAPLKLAASFGLTEIAQLLLDRGADINATDGDWTPLIKAAFYGEIGMVEFLLENGADAETKDEWGRTASFYASMAGYPKTRKLIEQHIEKEKNK